MLLGLLAALQGFGAAAPAQVSPSPPRLERLLPPKTDAVVAALGRHITGERAREIVVFMDQFWRVAPNPGFLASQDYIRGRLIEEGYRPRASGAGGAASVWYEEFPADTPGWDHARGTLSLLLPLGGEEVLLSREQHRVALCINSFSTPPGGRTLRVVDVGKGDAADFEGKDVTGALVLGGGAVDRLWDEAVRARGAAGVVSSHIDDFVARPAPGASAEETLDVLQWGEIPYDEGRASFAFKATRRATERLREALKHGPVAAKVDIESRFYRGQNRSLSAEIRGRAAPEERIVLVAHVQEPGANDNGSGCGTLFEIAAGIYRGIRDGTLPVPDRTLTFLWLDETRGSEQWVLDHADEVKAVRYMFSLDMTGENTALTGGVFRIEKQPDPSAVWARASDPHTEWGKEDVAPETLRGSLLNDVHLAVCQRIARDSSWPIATNPYEGGSDHTVFNAAGVPSVLDWHFTDRYYHTNLDRPDKVDAAEMKNVGLAVGTTAVLLASADADDAHAVTSLVAQAARARFEIETMQSRAALARPGEPDAAVERTIFQAWKVWYEEALMSVLDLPVGGPDEALERAIAREIRNVRLRDLELK